MLKRVSGESVAGVAASCKEERRDNWKKADTEDTVSPCPPAEDLEDLERNRRNDSDVGAAERLSSLERRKRAVLNTSAKPIPCLRKAFMTD